MLVVWLIVGCVALYWLYSIVLVVLNRVGRIALFCVYCIVLVAFIILVVVYSAVLHCVGSFVLHWSFSVVWLHCILLGELRLGICIEFCWSYCTM